ncbi:MAG: CvpA family protein [Rudaea sp.]
MLAFNWVDLSILGILVLGLATGWLQGLVRQVIALAALYLGAILATQYFAFLGTGIKSILIGTPGIIVNAISFFAIMLTVTAIINFLANDAARMNLRVPAVVDRLGGMVLGLAGAWILVTLAVQVLAYSTGIAAWGDADNMRSFISDGIHASRLADLAGATVPAIIGTMKPWLPAGLPSIFVL